MIARQAEPRHRMECTEQPADTRWPQNSNSFAGRKSNATSTGWRRDPGRSSPTAEWIPCGVAASSSPTAEWIPGGVAASSCQRSGPIIYCGAFGIGAYVVAQSATTRPPHYKTRNADPNRCRSEPMKRLHRLRTWNINRPRVEIPGLPARNSLRRDHPAWPRSVRHIESLHATTVHRNWKHMRPDVRTAWIHGHRYECDRHAKASQQRRPEHRETVAVFRGENHSRKNSRGYQNILLTRRPQ